MRFPSLLTAAYYYVRSHWLELRPWAELAEEEGLRGKSLAIVGNAGYLRELEQGVLIDSFDLVLRMNNFETRGFEPQLGERCDIYMSTFNQDVRLNNPGIARAKYTLASIPANFLRIPEWGIHTRGGVDISAGLLALGRDRIYVPDSQNFGEWIARLGAYPTTGAMALLLALGDLTSLWHSVYVTGFSFFQGQSHYYTDKQTNPRNHEPNAERYFLRQLIKPGYDAGHVRLDPRLEHQLFHDDARRAA